MALPTLVLLILPPFTRIVPAVCDKVYTGGIYTRIPK
jgi:hypothetical protein